MRPRRGPDRSFVLAALSCAALAAFIVWCATTAPASVQDCYTRPADTRWC